MSVVLPEVTSIATMTVLQDDVSELIGFDTSPGRQSVWAPGPLLTV